MPTVTKYITFFLIVAVCGCESRPSGVAGKGASAGGADAAGTADGNGGTTAGAAEKEERPTRLKAAQMPEWEAGANDPVYTIAMRDGRYLLERQGQPIAGLAPHFEVVWRERAGAEPQSLELPATVTLPAAGDGATLLTLGGEAPFGSWKIDVSTRPGSPTLAFEAEQTFTRDILLERFTVRFDLPGDDSPELLDRNYTWTPVAELETGLAVSPVVTPPATRWPRRGLTMRGVDGVDRVRVEPVGGEGAEKGWRTSFDLYAAERHPMKVAKGCSGPPTIDDSAARLSAGSRRTARWEWLVGAPDLVVPSRNRAGNLASVALIVDTPNPTMESVKALDFADPRVDSDGMLELGVAHTKVVPPGDEGIGLLGGYPRSARSYGVEFAPGAGPPEAPLFTGRLAARTWVDLPEGTNCDAVYRRGAAGEKGAFDARLEAGFRYFWDGTTRAPEQFQMLTGEPPFYSFPHATSSSSAGASRVALFDAIELESAEAVAQLLTPDNVSQFKKDGGFAVLFTDYDSWMVDGEDGPVWEPGARNGARVLARFLLEFDLSLGPVEMIVGHALAMQEMTVDYQPGGWVRVTNNADYDLAGATFILPEGGNAVVTDAREADTSEGRLWFDVGAGETVVFRVYDAEGVPEPARFVLER